MMWVKKNSEKKWLVRLEKICQEDNELDPELTGSRLSCLPLVLMFLSVPLYDKYNVRHFALMTRGNFTSNLFVPPCFLYVQVLVIYEGLALFVNYSDSWFMNDISQAFQRLLFFWRDLCAGV
jgi:hypothetical protein